MIASNKNFLIKYNILKNNISNKNKSRITNSLFEILSKINFKKDIFHQFSKKCSLDFKKKDLTKYKKFKNIVIIGMGGSIQGSKAIYGFLQKKIKKNLIFFDNPEHKYIEKKLNKINLKQTLYIIISKSGNTIETLTMVNMIKKGFLNSKNTIIITEKKKSALYEFSKKYRIKLIEHKNYIGGRYSVLSEVGLLPSYLMGLNIDEFKKNILNLFKKDRIKILVKNLSLLTEYYSLNKIKTIVFLNYAPEVKEFLFWLQQLISESLGKKGRGLLPKISTAPKDHHSLLQLYLDGPKDKLFYVISSKASNNQKITQNYFNKNFNFISGKNLFKIIDAQQKAVVKVFKKKNIPLIEIKINKFSEKTLGELFAYFMIETIVVGKNLKINPFDQPAVEEVKKLTKKILTN